MKHLPIFGKYFDLTPLFNQPPNAKDEKQRERHGKKYLIVVSCDRGISCLLYTSPSPRDVEESRMPSSA